MFRRIFSYKFFPLAFTILTIVLLCLPGSMVPGTGIFSIKNLDKIVHVFLFGMNVLFWGWHFWASGREAKSLRIIFITATILVSLLGILMEYVQMYFIPNRSFDGYDILADIVGAVLAGLWLLRS
ncbi:MAG: VanZ family protein [Chitinophagaceae bacterium]|nr:VanZ family protein [Chitinophagaceae bacterium]